LCFVKYSGINGRGTKNAIEKKMILTLKNLAYYSLFI